MAGTKARAVMEEEEEEEFDEEAAGVKLTGRLIPLNPDYQMYAFGRQDKVVIGRSNDVDIPVVDMTVSKRHCELYFRGSRAFLKDTSVNGTQVADRAVKGEEVEISNGDRITVVASRSRRALFAQDGVSFFFHIQTESTRPLFVPSTDTDTIMRTYVFQRKLGKGAFGTVWQAVPRAAPEGGAVYAAKVIDKRRYLSKGGQDVADILKEVRALESLRHPNIVSIADAYDTPRHVALFLEFVGGGTLEDVLERHPRGLPEGQARGIFHQLCGALAYLHEQGVVHRDLKPENVMMTAEEAPAVKVTDFGLARVVGPQSMMTTVCGTPLYLAPEVIEAARAARAYDARVDMWSAGVILHRLLFGALPFRGAPERPLHAQVLAAMRPGFRLQLPAAPRVSPNAMDLVSRLLCEPGRRLWAPQALQHPWLTASRAAAPSRDVSRAATMRSGSSPAPAPAVGGAGAGAGAGGGAQAGDAAHRSPRRRPSRISRAPGAASGGGRSGAATLQRTTRATPSPGTRVRPRALDEAADMAEVSDEEDSALQAPKRART